MFALPAIELNRVSKLYGRTTALRAVSARVEEGGVLALLGPNGSGKTTLLKVVAGAISPTLGRCSVFGHDVRREARVVRPMVGLLAGETYLYDDLTAFENLRFIAIMAGLAITDDGISELLQDVRLGPSAADRVRSFSSGMKRRLAVARVEMLRPRVLLLDEPYNSLDAGGAELVDMFARRTAAKGGAVIIATHDAERALALAGFIVELNRGAIAYSGPVAGYRARGVAHVG